MFKFFLKLLGGTRTRIRILGSGSIKKNHRNANATDSGSGRGPDPRIIPNWMRMHLDPDSWIRIQEFLCGPQIRIGSVRPPPPDLIGLELLLYVKVTRHLRHLWEPGNAMPWSRTIPSRSGDPKLTDTMFYHYHLTVNPPELTRNGRLFVSARSVSLGLFLRMTRCRVGIFNADKPEFPDVC